MRMRRVESRGQHREFPVGRGLREGGWVPLTGGMASGVVCLYPGSGIRVGLGETPHDNK